MDDIIFHTEKRLISDLIPNAKNPRTLSKKHHDLLQGSLKKFGLVGLPEINLDNKVISGHQRLKVLSVLKGGNYEIEVRVPNRMLTDKEAEELLILDNYISGDWDIDIFANEWDFDDLKEFGFESWELGLDEDFTLSELDDDIEMKPKEEKPPKLVVKLDYTDEPEATFIDKLDEFLKEFPDVKKK